MAIGALLFLVVAALAAPLGGRQPIWSVAGAHAGEAIATRAVELTAPPGPTAENAIVAVAQMRPAADPLLLKRLGEFSILLLTFSALVAMNLAFLRHLKRVNAGGGRNGRRSVGDR
jgi:hypothetical protein